MRWGKEWRPSSGDTRVALGFAWWPKRVVCGSRHLWVWLEGYHQKQVFVSDMFYCCWFDSGLPWVVS